MRLLRFLFSKLTFYKFLVLLGAISAYYVLHVEASKYCQKQLVKFQVADIVAQIMCPDKKCIVELRTEVNKSRKAHVCKYIQYGQ